MKVVVLRRIDFTYEYVWYTAGCHSRWSVLVNLRLSVEGSSLFLNDAYFISKRQKLKQLYSCCLTVVADGWSLLGFLTTVFQVLKSRIMRWAGLVARMGEERVVYRVLVGKPEGRRPLGRPRRRWLDNIRMDLQEVVCGYMDWIGLAQDRDRWRTLVSAVMNLRVPWNVGNFLTSCKTVSCSGRTLHHGVSK